MASLGLIQNDGGGNSGISAGIEDFTGFDALDFRHATSFLIISGLGRLSPNEKQVVFVQVMVEQSDYIISGEG